MSDILSRLTTALVDRYRVQRELGAGGMATVYLAHDLRHERDVAIKVLHPDLGAALGGERFLTEIRTTARLQHPHILPLLDSGEADGLLFYVMPYIAGETLRARLTREKVLPVAEAVRITREIASALDYAHRQQVIHRDIKPENILLHDGSALVADFGIALAVQQAGGARMTQTGLSLGTPQYMSPEQAMGERSIDARSDLYALGAMCYEMLTGDAPFTGNTVQAIVAKVMTEKPVPLRTVRDTVPPHVEQAVLACLAKLPADRPATAKAFGEALVASGTSTASASTAPTHRAAGRSRTPLVAMAVVTLAAVSVAGWAMNRSSSLAETTPLLASLELAGSETISSRSNFALSPDGLRVAYVGSDSGGIRHLYVRELDAPDSRLVTGADGADYPMWSPDGTQLAFFAEQELRRIDANGGRAQRITTAGTRFGGRWIRDDLIVFTSTDSPLLQAVSPTGGAASVFLDGDEQIEVFTGIQEFDDGEHVLTRVLAASDSGSPSRFYLAKIEGARATRVREITSLRTPAGTTRSVTPRDDQYLIVEDGEVLVATMDANTREIVGDPLPLLSGRRVSRISASRTGRLIYGDIPIRLNNALVQLDRRGQLLRSLGPKADGIGFDYFGARYSRDGQSVFYEYHSGKGTGDLYRVDTRDGRVVRQTLDESHHNAFLAVAPDGRIVFTSTRDGNDLFVKQPDGAPEQRIPLPMDVGFPSDWSPDGQWILFSNTGIGGDIWRTKPNGDSLAPVLNSPASELHAVFSPDGKWLAYASDQQGGRFDVYLRRWPVTTEQWVVSTAGGEAPRWRGDGKELFFLRRNQGTVNSAVMAASIDLSGPTPVIGRDTMLFTSRFRLGDRNLRSSVNYDVSRDGMRFVGPVLDDDVRVGPALLHLIANWPAALARRTKSAAP